jgi:PAS domain S-box-containing protein
MSKGQRQRAIKWPGAVWAGGALQGLALPVGLLLLFGVLAMIVLLGMAGNALDRSAAAGSAAMIRAAVGHGFSDLTHLGRHLAGMNKMDDTLRTSIVGAAAAFIFEAGEGTGEGTDGAAVFGQIDGEPVDPRRSGAIIGGLAWLLNEARQNSDCTTGMVGFNDAIHLAAAPAQPGNPVVLLLRRLDGDLLGRWAATMGVQDLRVVSVEKRLPPGQVGLVLTAIDSTPLGQLCWHPSQPGQQLLKEFAPPLVGILLVMFGLAVLFLRRLRGVTARMADDADRLAEQDRKAQSSEVRYRAVVDAIPELILIGRHGRIDYINGNGAELLGASSAEMVHGQPIERFIVDDDAPELPVAEPDRPPQWRGTWLRRSAGDRVNVELTALRIDASDDAELLVIARDMSQHRRIEQSLREAKEQAELANRAKNQFLANMSHELRTPLNAIIGFSEIIADKSLGPEAVMLYMDYAQDIRDSGLHLLAVINDILDYSKLEAGKMEISEDIVGVSDTIAAAVRVVLARAEAGGLKLRQAVEDGVPSLVADNLKLKQIIHNLLTNSIKFTPEGGQITVSARRSEQGGIDIAVADTGIGMTEEEIAIGLQPFRQVQSELSRRYEGTGLGLPIASSLTGLHGGQLEIASTPGVGTTVTIHLPAARVFERPVAIPFEALR